MTSGKIHIMSYVQTIKEIINTTWPIDLYIPYGEYHYGIYKYQ